MVIKGPRSALTDFIEEQKIDIKKLQLLNQIPTKKKEPVSPRPIKKRRIKKKINNYEIKESVNLTSFNHYDQIYWKFLDFYKNDEIAENDLVLSYLENEYSEQNNLHGHDNIGYNIESTDCDIGLSNMDSSNVFIDANPIKLINSKLLFTNSPLFPTLDQFLEGFSKFLSRKRLMNQDFYDFLVKNSKNTLKVFDCSSITRFHLNNSCKHVELHTCGQMLDTSFLLNCRNIEKLTITGAFRIRTIPIPEKLRKLDISFCTNIKDDFFDNIDKNAPLEELVLNNCYGLDSPQSRVSFQKIIRSLKRISINETFLDENFLEFLGPDLEELSIAKCKNIFPIGQDNKKVRNKNVRKSGKTKKFLKFDARNGVLDITTFKKLRRINIEGISTIKQLKTGPEIEALNLNYCFGITEVPKGPVIKELKLSGLDIENLDDIKAMKQLKKLDLSWNKHLNHDMLVSIVEALELEEICVFGCFGLTNETVKFGYENPKGTKIIGCPYETNYLMNR